VTDQAPEPIPQADPAALAAQPGTTGLTDGEWHRLHPASPLLKGGIMLLAIIGFIVYNFRDTLLNTWLGGPEEEDPLTWLIETQGVGLIALAVAGLLVVLVIGFYLSWRFHTFRITDELVEVRSGILFRTHRKARLDRVQGINIVRPFLARLFGAAKLEINVAGQDANVQLSYLGSVHSDQLRAEVLRLASGTRQREAAEQAAATGQPAGIVEQRVHELLAPELDPNAAPPESIVKMHPGRLVGSLLLSGTTVMLIVMVVGVLISVLITRELFWLFAFVPAVLGLGGYYWNRFTKSLRYTIASTPDGIRIGFGLLSTSNDTLPPGRIHSVQVSQPLLWRPAGWWEIKVNRATKSSAQDAGAGQQNTTILPVGDRNDAMRVLGLVLPTMTTEEAQALLTSGLISRGGDDGFTTSPRRARIWHWFSWRRNGFAITPEAIVLRRGAVWRQLLVVPLARVQSISVTRGPIGRAMRLADLRVQTVAGPIMPYLTSLDETDVVRFFDEASAATIASAQNDTSHRWRSAGQG